jgi:STE24 endopeptidase
MNEAKATLYQRARRRTDAVRVVCGVSALAVVAVTPASGWLAAWAADVGAGLSGALRNAIALAAFSAAIVLVWQLGALPCALYRALRVDNRFLGTGRSVEEVLVEAAQSTAALVPVVLAAGGLVRLAASAAGPGWWAAAGGLLALAGGAALHGAPLLLARLAGARPLDRPALAERLSELARRAYVPVARIDQWRSPSGTGATALVAGVGRTRRVFVSADLLRDWSDDEIAVVVAHELAHHAYRDLWRTLALDAGVLAAGLASADVVLRLVAASLGFTGPGDLAALPLIALVAGVVWLAATPLRHAESRRQERRADLFALVTTGAAGAFGAVIRRLGERHLAESHPSPLAEWLYGRHPSVADRLAVAEGYARIRAEREAL